MALLLGVFAQNLLRTRIGRAFMAVRDRDLAAEVMGVDLFRTKVTAFALSAFYAGIAGAIWAPYVMIISPEQFEIHLSIELLAMIIIGGMGSVMGSVYGAAFMTVLPIVVRELSMALEPIFPSVRHQGCCCSGMPPSAPRSCSSWSSSPRGWRSSGGTSRITSGSGPLVTAES